MHDSGRIVVGGDTTPAGSAALLHAVELARRVGCTLLVVHAFDVAGRADLAVERDLERARRDARYRTQSWVVEILGDSTSSVPVMVQTPDGRVEDALVAASRGARLVVVGEPQDDGHRALAAALAARCACPVVTVAPGGASSRASALPG